MESSDGKRKEKIYCSAESDMDSFKMRLKKRFQRAMKMNWTNVRMTTTFQSKKIKRSFTKNLMLIKKEIREKDDFILHSKLDWKEIVKRCKFVVTSSKLSIRY